MNLNSFYSLCCVLKGPNYHWENINRKIESLFFCYLIVIEVQFSKDNVISTGFKHL